MTCSAIYYAAFAFMLANPATLGSAAPTCPDGYAEEEKDIGVSNVGNMTSSEAGFKLFPPTAPSVAACQNACESNDAVEFCTAFEYKKIPALFHKRCYYYTKPAGSAAPGHKVKTKKNSYLACIRTANTTPTAIPTILATTIPTTLATTIPTEIPSEMPTDQPSINPQGAVRVTSDATSSRPAVSYSPLRLCEWNTASQGQAADALCQAAGYSSGAYVSASNNPCKTSHYSDEFVYYDLVTGKVQRGYPTRPLRNNAQITADCKNSTPSPTTDPTPGPTQPPTPGPTEDQECASATASKLFKEYSDDKFQVGANDTAKALLATIKKKFKAIRADYLAAKKNLRRLKRAL
jgi:hypothetical protein